MRKKIIGLILVSSLTVACDPHEDVYVPREIKHACNDESQGSPRVYRTCLRRNGCKVKPDPMPLSNYPVFICTDEN